MVKEIRPEWFLISAVLVVLLVGGITYLLFNQRTQEYITLKSKLVVLDCSDQKILITNHGDTFQSTNMSLQKLDGTVLFTLSIPSIRNEETVRIRLPERIPAGEYILVDGGREVQFSCH